MLNYEGLNMQRLLFHEPYYLAQKKGLWKTIFYISPLSQGFINYAQGGNYRKKRKRSSVITKNNISFLNV